MVDQSIEIVRRRIDELGTKEPVIQRQGSRSNRCTAAGAAKNPEYVKTLLGKTAKMAFHLLTVVLRSARCAPRQAEHDFPLD